MPDGSEANPVGALDRIHAQIVGESSEPQTAQTPAVEAQPDKVVAAPDHEDSNADFAREVIAEICETNAATTYQEFYDDLAPIVGHAIADRIAKRAFPDSLKNAYVKHGGNVAAKYGVAQFMDSETILVGAALLHWRGFAAAKKEREKLLKKHSPANGAQRDSATGPTYPDETKREKPAQPTQGLTANAPITTIELVVKEPKQ